MSPGSISPTKPTRSSRVPEYLRESSLAEKYELLSTNEVGGSDQNHHANKKNESENDGYGSIMLPSGWNPKEKCSLLELAKGNLRANYIGTGRSDSDAAAVRANYSMPSQCGIYYFEVEIVSKGRDGYIGIGFCSGNVSLNRLPGWEPNSWGYHGDDGHSFQCSGTGKAYGPTFTTGDVIGCCVNFIDKTAFYTKNGVNLGVAFRDLPINKPLTTSNSTTASTISLFPSVGLRTPNESVEVNFGQSKFKFDIDSFVKEEKSKLWYHIHSSPISTSYLPSTKDELKNLGSSSSVDSSASLKKDASTVSGGHFGGIVNELILSYLVHSGYSETASTFIRNLVGTSVSATSPNSGSITSTIGDVDARLKEIKVRQQIRTHVLEGDIDAAITMTNEHYPNVLPSNEPILFQLRCRKFIEMMAQINSISNAMEEDFDDLDAAEVSSVVSQDAMDIDEPQKNSQSGGLVGNGRNSGKPRKVSQGRSDAAMIRDALKYGQELQNDYAHDSREDVKQALVETFSLLAYPDPYTSAVSYLLDPSRRAQVADALNSAILVSQNQPPIPHIELMYKQSAVAVKELAYSGNGAGALINVQKDIL
ncbi:concanavalin A-like lectin/glucanase domain-containing protein [Paraphysoderma sedebokerense]|nr:concanavalin A-like lectin/glucanase domain-containing protein [Paraphysoderma sedebokerense]